MGYWVVMTPSASVLSGDIYQRLGADDHCRGVDGGIACEILQHKRGINQLA